MHNITAIGFDLFNTLITVDSRTLVVAIERLIQSLREGGIAIEAEPFKKAYRIASMKHVESAKEDGRETHNSLWISAALEEKGDPIPPEDPRISAAVENYFSAFFPTHIFRNKTNLFLC